MGKEKKGLPLSLLLGYGAGQIGIGIVDRAVVAWVMFFYVPSEHAHLTLLVSAKFFGAAMLLGRVVDAVMDPLVSYWTDSCRSRFGRRAPFLAFGGVGLALSTTLIYLPLGAPQSLFVKFYLMFALSLFFTFFTLYVVPYLALYPELAKTDSDRINLSTSMAIFNLGGVIIGMIGSGFLIRSVGYAGMAGICSILSAVSFCIPLLVVREGAHVKGAPVTIPLFRAISQTLKNSAFRNYVTAICLYWFGFNMVTTALPYYVAELLHGTEDLVSKLLAVTFGITTLSFPIVNKLSKAMGKEKLFLYCLGFFTALLPTLYFINHPLLPIPPKLFLFGALGLAGLPIAALFILPNALIADLTDLDEKITGHRREAMFFGVQGLLMKSSFGLSSMFLSFLFDAFGYSGSHLLGLRLTGPLAGLFALIGLWFFARYPKQLLWEREHFPPARPKLLSLEKNEDG